MAVTPYPDTQRGVRAQSDTLPPGVEERPMVEPDPLLTVEAFKKILAEMVGDKLMQILSQQVQLREALDKLDKKIGAHDLTLAAFRKELDDLRHRIEALEQAMTCPAVHGAP